MFVTWTRVVWFKGNLLLRSWGSRRPSEVRERAAVDWYVLLRDPITF